MQLYIICVTLVLSGVAVRYLNKYRGNKGYRSPKSIKRRDDLHYALMALVGALLGALTLGGWM